MQQDSSSNRTTREQISSATLEDRALQRRLAFAASTHNARIMGKVTGVFIMLLGAIFGALLSGFGLWTPRVSWFTVPGALIAAIAVSWLGAVLLQTAPMAALLFAIPMLAGMVFATWAHQWWSSAILLACTIIPFAALALYQFDQRKSGQRSA
jgi:hypothetical protein